MTSIFGLGAGGSTIQESEASQGPGEPMSISKEQQGSERDYPRLTNRPDSNERIETLFT